MKSRVRSKDSMSVIFFIELLSNMSFDFTPDEVKYIDSDGFPDRRDQSLICCVLIGSAREDYSRDVISFCNGFWQE